MGLDEISQLHCTRDLLNLLFVGPNVAAHSVQADSMQVELGKNAHLHLPSHDLGRLLRARAPLELGLAVPTAVLPNLTWSKVACVRKRSEQS